MAHWSYEVDALNQIVDRLGNLIAAVVATTGSRPPKVTPSPRPRTAADRIRVEVRLTQHQRLVARLLPDRPT